MAKRSAAGMTGGEKIWGGILLALHLTVLPEAAGLLYDFLEARAGLPAGGRDTVYKSILLVLSLVIFSQYLRQTTRAFFSRVGRTSGTAALGLVILYGLNALARQVLQMFPLEWENPNDQSVLARMGTAPGITILTVVFLSPFIEELLFRGYIFGNLREYHRGAAYVVSCLLFALAHVWPYMAGAPDWNHLLLLVQYLLPGAVMAWAFERSDTLWGSVLLHIAVNALSAWRAF